MHTTPGYRPLRLSLLASAVMLATLPAAHAFELDTGSEDWAVRFDNTLKTSYGQRVEGQNSKIANASNYNDGDKNFSVGSAVTQRVDLLTELDVVYQRKMGFRVSAASWYDHAYDNVGSNSNPFPGQQGNAGNLVAARQSGAIQPGDSLNGHAASKHGLSNYSDRYYNGPSGEILDAFVFYSTEVGEESMFSTKLGRHNMYWGETLFNAANGINYGQSALDLAKLYNVPGTETKELFLPRNQLSMSFTVNPELTLGAQYFLEFRNTRLPEGGTYMGGYDMFGEGGDVFWLPVPTALNGAGAFYGTSRGHDVKPHNAGDFGLMAKWSPEWLDGTLGFYYRNTSDPMPVVLVNAPNLQTPGLPGLTGAEYLAAYADDIDIYGISLSKGVGPVSVGLDVNYRENMPLLSNFTTINPTLSAQAEQGLVNGDNLISASSRTPWYSGPRQDVPCGTQRHRELWQYAVVGLLLAGCRRIDDPSGQRRQGQAVLQGQLQLPRGRQSRHQCLLHRDQLHPDLVPGVSGRRYVHADVLQRWPQGQLGRPAGWQRGHRQLLHRRRRGRLSKVQVRPQVRRFLWSFQYL